ncbi:hypothetical protein SBOR_0082 [Sclerotinia borealis F-4128]|uniref:Uncharacterized protein n=1 Tax=Sclerotinia borealis (strain F-4128) TaxID=1432307 RepID=W9CRT8_SCLBF|nr:hypothetical protein SBOR_0082 [Sclerotinia borealis F-4128]
MSSSTNKNVQNDTPLSSSGESANNTLSLPVQTPFTTGGLQHQNETSSPTQALPFNTNSTTSDNFQHENQLIHAQELGWGTPLERHRVIAQLYANERQRVRVEQRAADLKEELDVERKKTDKLRADLRKLEILFIRLKEIVRGLSGVLW